MALGINELDPIIAQATQKIMFANRVGTLDALLQTWGLLTEYEEEYPRYKSGMIVVLGSSAIKKEELIGICKSYGIDKTRLEFCLDYDAMVKYDFSKLCNTAKYSAVIIGPIPHSTCGKERFSSAITALERDRDFPAVKRLVSGQKLKITKSNFKAAIEELLKEDIICAG